VSFPLMSRDRPAAEESPESPNAVRERRLAAVFDRTFQLVGLLSPDGVLLEANRTALDFAGIARDDVIGRPVGDTPWWPRDDETQDRLRRAVAAAAGGAFVRYEAEVIGAGGRLAVMDFSLKPVADEHTGRVLFLIAEGRDVTDRRRTDDALRLSEAKLAGIVSVATDAVISVDDTFRIVLFNRGAEAIFGYSPAEAIGEPLDLLLPDGLGAQHREHLRAFSTSRVAARRMGERQEIHGRRKSGEVFPAEAAISKIEVGGHRFYTAVLRDVTRRKRAEQEKAELLARTEAAHTAAARAAERSSFLAEAGAILEASLDYEETLRSIARLAVPRLGGLCVVDMLEGDGTVRRLEVAAADPALADAGATLRGYPLDARAPFLTRRAIESGRPELVAQVDDGVLRGHTQDAEHLAIFRALAPTSLLSVPLVARGRVLGAIGLVTSGHHYTADDLTLAEELARRAALAVDNAALYREARRATALRDTVLGTVSHDLRNPLSAIAMVASRLAATPPGDSASVRALGQVVKEAADLSLRLIRDLLDVSSIAAGRLSLERRPDDVEAIVAKARHLLAPIAAERDIRLTVDVPPVLPGVEVDAERVIQALGNLAGNALKFTRAGGTVTIRAASVADGVQLSVSDTGPGIPADELPHLFDRFWQARRTARERGSGLGLAIAKGIVEAHGGRLWVESEVGVGSTFHFTLPASAGLTPG
jgi:PAS domain S-box-containing protein